MERELDLFVSQIGLARMVCAASFSSSIHDAVRKGQEIGLQTLREMLETANVPAGLSLSDVDGRLWEMVCRPRGFGRGYVSIFIDGNAADWSGETSRRGGHLTEVV